MLFAKRFIFIQFSLDFISGAFLVVSSWTIFASTGSATITGIYVSFGFLPSLLTNIYIGAIVDRWDAKKMMQISLATMFSAISFTILSFLSETVFLLFIAQMMMQLAGSIFRPSVQVYMTHLYEAGKLKYMFTKSASISILGGVIGAFIASQFLLYSISYIFVMMIFMIIIAFAVSFQLPYHSSDGIRQKINIHQDIKDGFRYAKSKAIFIKLFILLGSGQVITHCTTGFLAAYTYETFTNKSEMYGYLQISLTIGGIVLGFCTTKYLEAFEKAFSKWGFVLLSICLMLCAFCTQFIFVGTSLFMIGMLTTWIRSHYQAIQQINTDRKFNGKMASFRMIINQGSVVIISPLLGLLGTAYGINTVFGFLAIIAIIAYVVNIKLSLLKHV
ncbi:MFS transporter [Solibacillus silvestris]|uniref:MFS transporter n=1 Tax=Solibacillus silvestris TaxID=76853 RepID=UPI003F818AD4